MPATRRSQSAALSKSNLADTDTKSSACSSVITDDVTDSDFQPFPNLTKGMSATSRRARVQKRNAAEFDSSDMESVKERRRYSTTSLAVSSSSRRKGKEKATDSLTSSSSNLMESEYTPATSISDDFGTSKVVSEDEEDQEDIIILVDDDETDDGFKIDSASETDIGSSSDEVSSTPLWSRTSRQNVRRRISTRSRTAIEPIEHLALDSDTSIEESETPLSDRTRAESVTPVANTRARNRRNRRERPPRKSWFARVNDKLIEHHPELITVWDDLENSFQAKPIPVDQPKDLVLPLLPFQKEGVGWMRDQEKSPDFKGGILADEMGMGKTIQTIAMLLEEPRKKPNLVVAPTVALMQWKREIETHTNSVLNVYLYHGASRSSDKEFLRGYDVILTTYSILESAFRKQEYGFKRSHHLVKEASLLHQIHWHRIILDEAHNIKDRSNNTARSVFNLQSEYKWSLTGTPLQNRVGELYSLIRFMQADPFGYYYCKSCPCKQLTWKFSDRKSCDFCGHKPMDHVCWWNNEILKPIQTYGTLGEGLEAFKKLRNLLDRMMLRRTKLERADDLGLPPRTVVVRRDLFNEEEEDMYQSLYSDSARKFTTYVEQGTVLNNYANIFELLMKMRQCSNHPDMVLKRSNASGNQQLVCVVCNEPPEDAIMSNCRHIFCRECCTQYLESFVEEGALQMRTPNCPRCFAILTVDLSQPTIELEQGDEQTVHAKYSKNSIVNRINMDKWRSSTKIEALVEELTNLQREDRSIKSIVFSQFVNFLDLVNWRLSRAGFECVKLDGTMSPLQRDAAIKHFMTNPNVTVFLISLKAGGVALNLTEASRVFICDPWWNPAAELQAMDRIHRLGQYRPIKITRLIIENSIESRIVQLQEKKTALVESTIGKDVEALSRLSEEDLRFLFVM
ncbi:SNF2 family N-terminal domain-containing protein [Umbelopsis sp. PMI_123]|nr:SNF2 family N-terminal domain-containing protein [Umbelopsis sp. PMI_123]